MTTVGEVSSQFVDEYAALDPVRAIRLMGVGANGIKIAGMDKYFEEVLEPVQNRSAAIPPVTDALIACMVGAGPKHGIEFV